MKSHTLHVVLSTQINELRGEERGNFHYGSNFLHIFWLYVFIMMHKLLSVQLILAFQLVMINIFLKD